MGGVTSLFDETDWEKANGKLRFPDETIDGSPPTNSYGVYTLTKKGITGMGGQRDYEVTDQYSNLLYTTRAVEGTVAWFDVLGRGIDEYLLRVQVDLSRRYWVVYSYGVPAFSGQIADQEATNRATASVQKRGDSYQGMPFLYRKSCITVTWARFEAIVAYYGPKQEPKTDDKKQLPMVILDEKKEDCETDNSINSGSNMKEECCNEEDNSIERERNEVLQVEGNEDNGAKQVVEGTGNDSGSNNDCTTNNEKIQTQSAQNDNDSSNNGFFGLSEDQALDVPKSWKWDEDEAKALSLADDNDNETPDTATPISETATSTMSAEFQEESSTSLNSEVSNSVDNDIKSIKKESFPRLRRAHRSFKKYRELAVTDTSEHSTSSNGDGDEVPSSSPRTTKRTTSNWRKHFQEPSTNDPTSGVLLSHQPILKVQEINSIAGQHQTLLPTRRDIEEGKKHLELAKKDSTIDNVVFGEKGDGDKTTRISQQEQIALATIAAADALSEQNEMNEHTNERNSNDNNSSSNHPNNKKDEAAPSAETKELELPDKVVVRIHKKTQQTVAGIAVVDRTDGSIVVVTIKEDGLFADTCLKVGMQIISISYVATKENGDDTTKLSLQCRGKPINEVASFLREAVGTITVEAANCQPSPKETPQKVFFPVKPVERATPICPPISYYRDDNNCNEQGMSNNKTMETSANEAVEKKKHLLPNGEQPLVGFWAWENTFMVHKMKMHVAKGSDLALHVILAIVTNQLRLERNATIASSV